VQNNFYLINVHKKPSIKSEIVTQLLYGECFYKIKKIGSWIKIKNNLDNYVGFIKEKNFSLNKKNTHKICNLVASLYYKPNLRSKIKKKLSFGSKIKVIERKNNFYKFNNSWVKKSDIKSIKYQTNNIFKNIKNFTGTKYKWGGKHFSGMDCSGLIQLFFNFNNRFCPRDASDQIKYFKKKVKLKDISKNNLIFWKGHVALTISNKKLIHAYGPFKKIVIMPISKTIARIEKIANLKVAGIRKF